MRVKEESDDYRYFPDPDLPPLVVDAALMTAVLRGLPELPAIRFARYVGELGLAPDDARTLIGDRALGDYFDAAVAANAERSHGRELDADRAARRAQHR